MDLSQNRARVKATNILAMGSARMGRMGLCCPIYLPVGQSAAQICTKPDIYTPLQTTACNSRLLIEIMLGHMGNTMEADWIP